MAMQEGNGILTSFDNADRIYVTVFGWRPSVGPILDTPSTDVSVCQHAML